MYTLKSVESQTGFEVDTSRSYGNNSPSQCFLSPMTISKERNAQDKHVMLSLLNHLAAHFLDLTQENLKQGMQQALEILGSFEQVDRSYIVIFSETKEQDVINNLHEWCTGNVESQKEYLRVKFPQSFTGFIQKIKNICIICIPDVCCLNSIS